MLRTLTYRCSRLIVCAIIFPEILLAGQGRDPSGVGGLEGMIPTASLDIYVQESNGAPVDSLAVVTLTTLAGKIYQQKTAKGGYVRFNELAASEYKIQVVAPGHQRGLSQVEGVGFETRRVAIALQPTSGADAALAAGIASIKPKAQKEVAKATEALRANKPAEARAHLEAANRMAPNQPDINYLFGVYQSQINDEAQAKSYWTKALQLNPNHFQTLLGLSEIAVRNEKPDDAVEYLKRAIEAQPSSWRAHAVLAEAYYLQHSCDGTIKEAERASELDHAQATMLKPLLARCLAERGERDQAIRILQAYLQDHPGDVAAKTQLERSFR
jgi:tetratricopeptide (TPR) repeat protein